MNTRHTSSRFTLTAVGLALAVVAGCSGKPNETGRVTGQTAPSVAAKPSASDTPSASAVPQYTGQPPIIGGSGSLPPQPPQVVPAPKPTPTPSAGQYASATSVAKPTASATPATATPSAPIPPADALASAVYGIDAYVYGYPLVTMEYTRRVMTNVAKPEGKFAPMGEFAHLRTYPSPSDKEVTAPNADTLYSLAWLDLGTASYLFEIPDSQDRYYLMPMLDGFTDVFQVPGKRTTGTKAQKYLITGPKTKDVTVPEGATHYKSATDLVWILGRTYCNGSPEDYAAVHKFQDGLKLTPQGGSAAKPTVDAKLDMKTAIREQVHALDADAYFTLLAKLLKTNPPTPADGPLFTNRANGERVAADFDNSIVSKLAKVGIVPGKDFDRASVDPAIAATFDVVPKLAQGKIMGHMKQAGTMVNGWTFSEKTGLYGTDYLQRAFITAIGLGANRPQDAVYPTAEVDGDGKPLNGANKYTVHFEKGKFPLAKAFWSITMYDAEYFFVPNPLDRYTVSSRFPFKLNDDGSLDLVIQHESPGKDKEANWLPAPAGKFILMMRLYWPEESMLDGSWKIPPVTPVK
jgi:hypothetical protein